MFTKTNGAAVQGIDALMIKIEVSVEQGFGFCIVGLPDTAVKESYQRILSAVKMCGIEFPRRKVVVNMSPADVKKEGSAYDLPLAIAVLAADEKVTADRLERFMLMGELSLDGSLQPIKGVHCNAQMTTALMHQYAQPDAAGLEKLKDAMTRFNMSARAYDRILRVARTIADLEGSDRVLTYHIQEAIGYRNLDRGNWAERRMF